MILISILVFIVIFSVVILVHEGGHFLAARLSGVHVEEFALGFGKRIWSRKFGETDVSLNAIPFGGYVKMPGEEGDSDDPKGFDRANIFKRMFITLAGVALNFVLAFLILSFLFWRGTNPILISEADVAEYEKAGLLQTEMVDGERKLVKIEKVQKSFPENFVFAGTEMWRISVAVVIKIGGIPGEVIRTGSFPKDLRGPVGMAEITHKIVPLGFLALMKFAALLSLSLGIMNLLPIPALDGGRFLFQLFELVLWRKLPAKFEQVVHYVGFLLLIGLLVLISFNDVWNLAEAVF